MQRRTLPPAPKKKVPKEPPTLYAVLFFEPPSTGILSDIEQRLRDDALGIELIFVSTVGGRLLLFRKEDHRRLWLETADGVLLAIRTRYIRFETRGWFLGFCDQQTKADLLKMTGGDYCVLREKK